MPAPCPVIAVAGLGIESSTFSPARTEAPAFHPQRGADALTRYPFLAHGQPLRSAADWRGSLVGKALPGGTVTASAYADLSGELIDRLKELVTVSRRMLATVAALTLCATALTTLGGSPASADGDDPVMTDPGFESGTFDGGQYYHASLVARGASGSGHAAQVGLDYDGDSRYPRGGNLPVRGTGVSRGMVNKPVRQVEPNTVY